MTVEHIEVLVEEPSMEAALRILLPRIIGDLSFEVYRHQCKDDLIARLPERLRGYAGWLPDNFRIIILVDRDDDDCYSLKNRLENIAEEAGLGTKSRTSAIQFQVVNRIVIEELEAWFFGDWDAVVAAFPRMDRNVPAQARYRNSDEISGGTWESLERLFQKAGYFRTGLRKIEIARSVARFMVPDRNASKSFQAFRDVLRGLIAS